MDKTLEQIKATCEEQTKKLDELENKNKELEKEKADVIASFKSIPVGNRSDSLEQKALNYFGKSNMKELLEVNTEDERAKEVVPMEVRAFVRDMKDKFNTARWIKQLFYGGQMDRRGSDQVARVDGILDTHYAKSELVPYFKALGSTVANEGDEWVPTMLAPNFIPEFTLDRKIAGVHEEVKMTSNPYELPIEISTPEATVIGEGLQATSSNMGTDKLTFTAKKFVQFTALPEELNADSAAPILQRSKQILGTAQIDAMEQCLLNGDDSATHQDADTHAGAAGLAAKAFKGHRKLAIANSATVDFAGAAISLTKVDDMIKLMDKFGVNVRDLCLVCNPSGYHQLKQLDEVTTVEKFGPQATILAPALTALRGIPIYISEYVRTGLNDSGVQDAVTTTKTVLHLFNRRRFFIGMRQPIRTRIMMDMADYDRWLMASYQRWAFANFTQGAAEKSTVLGIDILT